MDLTSLELQDKLLKLQKPFNQKYGAGYTVKYLLNNGFIATKVQDPTSKVISLGLPRFNMKGYIKFKHNDHKEEMEEYSEFYEREKIPNYIPEYAMISVGKDVYNTWIKIVEGTERYNTWNSSDCLLAENRSWNATITFRKHWLKGCYIFIGYKGDYFTKVDLP